MFTLIGIFDRNDFFLDFSEVLTYFFFKLLVWNLYENLFFLYEIYMRKNSSVFIENNNRLSLPIKVFHNNAPLQCHNESNETRKNGPRTPIFHILVYVGSWSERWASFGVCGVVGWDQSMKMKKLFNFPRQIFQSFL